MRFARAMIKLNLVRLYRRAWLCIVGLSLLIITVYGIWTLIFPAPVPLGPYCTWKADANHSKLSPSDSSGRMHGFHWHYRLLERSIDKHLYCFDWKLKMPLMRQEANESARDGRVRAGLAWMQTQGLVVASTLRNAMRGFPNSLSNVNRLRTLFNRSWLVFAESNSADQTRQYLHDLTQQDTTVRLLGCGQLNSREPCQPDVRYRTGKKHHPGPKPKRTVGEEVDRGKVMAAFRNEYMDYIYKSLVPQGATLLMVIDADMEWENWDLDNIAQGLYYFMAKPKLQQLCSHTCYWNRRRIHDPCTLTFFNNKHFGEDRQKPALTYDNSIRYAPPDLPPVKVSSCFQSLAFYRLSDMAARTVLYGGAPEEWNCEHNTLSRRLSEVYLDPQMQLNIADAFVG